MSFGSNVEDLAGKVWGFFKDVGIKFVKDHGEELAKNVIAKTVTTVMALHDMKDDGGRPLNGDKKFGYAVSTVANYAVKTGVTMAKHEIETAVQTVFGATIGAGVTDLLDSAVPADSPQDVIVNLVPVTLAPRYNERVDQLRSDIAKWKGQIDGLNKEPESEAKTVKLQAKSKRITDATEELAELTKG